MLLGIHEATRTSRRAYYHSWTSGRVFQSLPDNREGLPDIREGLSTTTEHSGGPPDQSWTSTRPPKYPDRHPAHSEGSPDHFRTTGSSSRPLPDIKEGLWTTPGHPGRTPNHSRTSVRPPGHPAGPATTPRRSAGFLDYSRTSRRASQPLLDIQEGLRPYPNNL